MDSAEGFMEQVDNLEQILSLLRHEIGNSVNSLKVTFDVLRENYDRFDDEKKKDYLRRGSDLIARQVKIVEAMKSYSSFDAEGHEEISSQSLWKQLLTTLSGKLTDSSINFVHHQYAGTGLVWGNIDAIQKVLANIVDNAMESVEGTENPAIEFSADEDNGFVRFLVKDNGCGIETENRHNIFIPLFTTKPGKMGMGLPIARRLLTKMDGRIEIFGPSSGGTEVKVWLRKVTD